MNMGTSRGYTFAAVRPPISLPDSFIHRSAWNRNSRKYRTDPTLYGPEMGAQARSSIGMTIPLNAPVNCEAEVEIDG
jgi:hypothetical protein